MEMINVKINDIDVKCPKGSTVLEAARMANIDIPTLCYMKDVSQSGSCRMCLVEIKGARGLHAACVYPVYDGMEVYTNTATVRETRKVTLELILSNHNRECLTCVRNRNCELQKLSEELGVTEIRYEGEKTEHEVDLLSPSIVRDNSKCILCRRCINACSDIQSVSVISAVERGFNTKIGSAFDMSLSDVPCVYCGQCIAVCPTGALSEKDSKQDVWKEISDPEKHVVVQVAPAVRAALGEEFGFPIGTSVTGKMVSALKQLGFDKVFDTNFGADLTIMEEGTELLDRIKNGGKLPMITSCSPGWIKFCEHNFPDFLDNLSTCKSPHEMFGAIIKSYYAEKSNIDPKNIVTVSVMPCIAKKFEAQRDELKGTGYPDVDYVITTRELAKMIKEAGIDFANLKDDVFDNPFGDEASGAAVIFGATGGVMEAALRTVSEIVEGKELPEIEYDSVRGTESIREATVNLGGNDIKIAVVHGLANARELFNNIRAGKADYHFIEVMACPGGCVTGGGQPIVDSKVYMDIDLKKERAKALYSEDKASKVRKSHQNPYIKKLYDEFLGEIGGEKSHKLLHTTYQARENY